MTTRRWSLRLAPSLLGVALAALCAVPAAAQPQRVAVSPASIDFGSLDVGLTAEVQVQIANVGGLPLTVERLSIDDDRFSVNSQGPFTFPPGNFWVVGVSFTPRDPGRADGVLSIETDDPFQPTVDVPLTGLGLGGELEVEPDSIEFGELVVGDRSDASVTLRNTGNTAIVAGVTPPPDPRFRVDPAGRLTVGAGQVRDLIVTFAPDVEGAAASFLQIQRLDPNGPPISVPLSGTAIRRRVGFEVDVSPAEVDLEPGSVAPVSYTLTETEGLDIDIAGGDAYLELPDGRRVELAARPMSRRLGPNGSVTLDDVVLLPRGVADDANGEPVRFVRMFVGRSDGRETTREAVVSLFETGSLGADFAITTLGIDSPTAGTTVAQGTPLHARAIVFGNGTGSALGAWVVNGLRIETFSVDLTAGRPVELETLISLPTGILGLHEVQIEVDEPMRLQSAPVPYLVTPRQSGVMRWVLDEGFRAFLRGGQPATWAWTPTTGVGGYDIRIDGAPVGRTRLPNWTLPAELGASLVAGEHVIEIAAAADATESGFGPPEPPTLEGRFTWLDAPGPIDTRCASGECRWDGPAGDGLFRIDVLDPSTGRMAYRRITRLRSVSVDDVLRSIAPAGRLGWVVYALNPNGEPVGLSPVAEWPGDGH